MVLISIIIPVYNVEKYIKRCIDSLINQIDDEVEIILINDGSTDNSAEICKLYAKGDSRIQYYTKKNGGLSSARNTGLQHVKGEYVCFVDSDDAVTENYIHVLKQHLSTDKPDLLYFGLEMQDDKRKNIRFSVPEPYNKKNSSIGERLEFIYSKFCKDWNNHVCDKCYKVSIIKDNKIYFESNSKVFAEDLCFNLYFLIYAEKLLAIDKCIYFYIFRRDSIMGSMRDNWEFRIEKMMDLLEVVKNYYFLRCDLQFVSRSFPLIYAMIFHKMLSGIKRQQVEKIMGKLKKNDEFLKNEEWILLNKEILKKSLGVKMGTYLFLEAFVFLHNDWKGKCVSIGWDALVAIKRHLIGMKEI